MKKTNNQETTKEKKEKEKLVCQSTIIKDYGIPKSMVEKLLPNPKLVRNPHYRCAAPMKLYPLSAVEGLLSIKDVQDAIEKHKLRSSAAKKAVQTKLDNYDAKINDAIKNIIVVIQDDVESKAIADYNDNETYLASLGYCEPKYITTNDNRDFLERITVNYIRHVLTDYDRMICDAKTKAWVDRFYAKVWDDRFYAKYKNGVLDAIAKAYPKYAAECERQKETYLDEAA